MESYSSNSQLQALEDGTALPSIVTPPPGPQSRELTERLGKVEPPTSSVIPRGADARVLGAHTGGQYR